MLPRGALTNLVKKGLELPVEPVKEIPKLPESFDMLPSFQNSLYRIYEHIGIEGSNGLTEKELREYGMDPDNLDYEDFSILGRKLDEESEEPISDYFRQIELLSEDSDIIEQWLNDEITLDQIKKYEGSQEHEQIVGPLLKELQEVYKLNKKQIRDYLIEQEILEED